MPTTLPRIQVSVTAELGRALDQAAQVWPDSPRSERLARLAELGAAVLDGRLSVASAARREAVRATSGVFASAYPKGYLADLRDDWPA